MVEMGFILSPFLRATHRFRLEAREVERLSVDQLVDLDTGGEATRSIAAGAVLVGDGVDPFLECVGADVASSFVRGDENWRWPSASALGRRALKKYHSGASLKGRDEVHRLVPVYLRPSEAERRLAAKRGEQQP